MDINLVKTKKRVALALSSKSFRDELEEIISSQLEPADFSVDNNSLMTLNHLADFFQPKPGRKPQLFGGLVNRSSQAIPINDLKTYTKYSRHERILRCKVASIFRLMNLFGWNTNSRSLLTICTSRQNRQYLVNPTGLLFSEITASSLMKIDSKLHVIDPGSTVLKLESDQFDLHMMIYSARPDVRIIFHVETPASVTVSYMDKGLLPLCHNAMVIGPVYNFDPFQGQDNPQGNLAQCLGINCKVLLVKSKGFFVMGETIEEAWHLATNMQKACETQVLLASLGEENLVFPSEKVVKKTYEDWRSDELGGVSPARENSRGNASFVTSPTSTMGKCNTLDSCCAVNLNRPLRTGELEFEALMRYLDNFGYRTGYLYRHKVQPNIGTMNTGVMSPRAGTLASPKVQSISKNKNYLASHSDTEDDEGVEIPPYTSSVGATLAYFFSDNDIDPLSGMSGTESDHDGKSQRISSLTRYQSDRRWFNTPNSYTKKFVDTDDNELASDESLSGDEKVFSMLSDSTAHYEKKKVLKKTRTKWISDREAALQAKIKTASQNGTYLPPPLPVLPLTAAAIPQGHTGGRSAFSVKSPPHQSTLVRGGGVPPGVTPNFFAPQGDDPKEYKNQQKFVKDKYYHDDNTSGPQSRLLESISWDEARRLRDEALSKALGARFAAEVSLGGQSAFTANNIVSAASKAIITKDIRNKAIIYDGLFSHQNPFDKITDEEIEMYRHEINLKQQQGGQGKSCTIDHASSEQLKKSIQNREIFQTKVVENKPYSDGEEIEGVVSEKSIDISDSKSPDISENSPSVAEAKAKKKKKLRIPFLSKKKK